jgi:hypothetical protein
MDDSQPIIVDPSLLQIDVPSMKTSTLLLDWVDSSYSAHMAVHFACWAYLFEDMMISLSTLLHLFMVVVLLWIL